MYVDGQEIKTTATHPFWVEGKSWVEAAELVSGDVLRLYSGELKAIDKVVTEVFDRPVKVYNFEVEDWHTYFVSCDEILVHNSCKWKSKATKRFWESYDKLPKRIKLAADSAFAKFKGNPEHPGLNFENIRNNLYLVRINQQYRAYGLDKGNGIIECFLINAHDYAEVYRMMGW